MLENDFFLKEQNQKIKKPSFHNDGKKAPLSLYVDLQGVAHKPRLSLWRPELAMHSQFPRYQHRE